MESIVQPEASVVQTGFGIRYVGDYAYAFSGAYEAATTAFTMLEFTTGSGVLRAEFCLNGLVRFTADVDQGGDCGFQISLNDVIVAILRLDTVSTSPGGPGALFSRMILPPFTKVEVQGVSKEDNANEHMSCNMHGRVYGVE
jgi:hypothetical protein